MTSQTTNPGADVVRPPAEGIRLGGLVRRRGAGTLPGLVVVYTFFAAMGGAVVLGASGWSSWLNMACEVGIIALPIGLPMIAGELDISVGAVLPAASPTVAIIAGHYDFPNLDRRPGRAQGPSSRALLSPWG